MPCASFPHAPSIPAHDPPTPPAWRALAPRPCGTILGWASLRASCNPHRKPYREDVPTILRERGFRFFFYMADRFEPPHVHVQRDDCAAKLWLDPLEFAFVEGFRRHEANDILHITE